MPMLITRAATNESDWAPADTKKPWYLKNHSYGEFVFDFAWANAYAQQGLSYYPKLLAAVPFTPVVGPRLLGAAASELEALALDQGCSSAHVLFANEEDSAALQAANWLERNDLRFEWHNQQYGDFDDFIAALSAKKRKNIRRERRVVAQAKLRFSWQAADAISNELWPKLFRLYASTYLMRGQEPYLNLACLQGWAQSFGQQFQFCIAWRGDEPLAMAFFFVDNNTLYGRHWGAAEDVDCLHFELCYYQGIEYAIRHGLQRFDAGVQGGHKLARGFDAAITRSFHWIADPQFRAAITGWVQQERAAVKEQAAHIAKHSAYKQRLQQDMPLVL